jgi:plasmid stabilization system protein ParE
MSRPPEILPEAEEDIAAARLWYENQRYGLGDEFIAALDDLLPHLAATPEMHQVLMDGVRRAKVTRFPYLVFYRAIPDRVEVLAVLHGSRNPSEWQRRL